MQLLKAIAYTLFITGCFFGFGAAFWYLCLWWGAWFYGPVTVTYSFIFFKMIYWTIKRNDERQHQINKSYQLEDNYEIFYTPIHNN